MLRFPFDKDLRMAWYRKWALIMIAAVVYVVGYNFLPTLMRMKTSDDLAWVNTIGTWVGSIGTVGALIGAIWIASGESREKRRQAIALAELTIAAIYYELKGLQTLLDGASAWVDVQDSSPAAYQLYADALYRTTTWKITDLVPLVVVPNHVDKHLALTKRLILTVTAALEAMTKLPLPLTQEQHHFLMRPIVDTLTTAKQNLDEAIKELDKHFIPSFNT